MTDHDLDQSNMASEYSLVSTAQIRMTFNSPINTANIMPCPDPLVKRQSAEEWFSRFRTATDNLISIYRVARQEIVGKRQALAE